MKSQFIGFAIAIFPISSHSCNRNRQQHRIWFGFVALEQPALIAKHTSPDWKLKNPSLIQLENVGSQSFHSFSTAAVSLSLSNCFSFDVIILVFCYDLDFCLCTMQTQPSVSVYSANNIYSTKNFNRFRFATTHFSPKLRRFFFLFRRLW